MNDIQLADASPRSLRTGVTAGVAALVVGVVLLIDDLAHQTVPYRIDPPSDCAALSSTVPTTTPLNDLDPSRVGDVTRCIPRFKLVETVASWRVPAMVAAVIVGAVIVVVTWVAARRLRWRGWRMPPHSSSWRLVAGDWKDAAILASTGLLFLLVGVLLVFVEPHGPTIDYGAPSLSSAEATAVLLGIAVVIGLVSGIVIGYATRSAMIDEEGERGIRRPAVRLYAAAATFPFVGLASLLAIEPTGGQRLALTILLPLAAFAVSGFVAWTVAIRTGLG